MRISAKAEYACTAMMELAAGYGEPKPMHVKTIAGSQGIPERFLVQVLLLLKKAGLIASIRGKSGGYQLARSPDSITLASIINAIDDTNATRDVPESFLARKAQRTPTVDVLLDVWSDIREQEQRMLGRITLAELLRRTQENNALTYQI